MKAVIMGLTRGNTHFVLKVWQNILYSLTMTCVYFNLYEFLLFFSYCSSFSEKSSTFSTRFSPACKLLIFNVIINDFILFVGRFVKFSFYLGEERFQFCHPCDVNVNRKRLNRQHSRTSHHSCCCNSL